MPPVGICADAGAARMTYACLPLPTNGMTCREAYDESCVLYTYECALSKRGRTILCGPVQDDAGNCCYLTTGDCIVS
jgi:hypothetical protein